MATSQIARQKIFFLALSAVCNLDTMRSAIVSAALRGVDVRIIVPHIPDKKIAFDIARSYYTELIPAGVRIYEFTPGFIHAKVFISDDLCGVVGKSMKY